MARINIDRLVAAHVAGLSLQQTANLLLVSKSTVQRALRDPDTQDRIEVESRRQGEADARRWQGITSRAMEVLDDLLTADEPSIQIRAVQTALRAADQFHVTHELAQRQEAINQLILERMSADEEDLEWPAE